MSDILSIPYAILSYTVFLALFVSFAAPFALLIDNRRGWYIGLVVDIAAASLSAFLLLMCKFDNQPAIETVLGLWFGLTIWLVVLTDTVVYIAAIFHLLLTLANSPQAQTILKALFTRKAAQ